MPTEPSLPARLAAILSSFETLGSRGLDDLDALYAPHVLFVDPIQQITSRAEFRLMNERLIERCTYVRFEDVTVIGEEPHFVATWKMSFKPRMGPEIRVHGASEFRSEDGLVVYHRDYWDLLSSVMASVPVLGPVYQRVVAMLG